MTINRRNFLGVQGLWETEGCSVSILSSSRSIVHLFGQRKGTARARSAKETDAEVYLIQLQFYGKTQSVLESSSLGSVSADSGSSFWSASFFGGSGS